MSLKEKKLILLLFLGALLVRMIYLFQMSGSPYFGAPFLDELYHLEWARDIAAGKWIRHDAFFRAPLYSSLLGIFIRIFGEDFFLIRLIQHLIGSLAVIAVYFLARRVFSRREALIAGVIAACYAPFFFFEGEMLDISLQFLLYPLILIFSLRTLEATSIKNTLLLGLLLGISALARPNILLFLPVLFLFFAISWIRKRDAFTDALFRLFLIGGIFIVTILPATLHNLKAGGCFVPISSYGGINFHIGNNPKADGYTARTARRMFSFHGYQDSVEMFAREEVQRKGGIRNPTASQVNRFWFRRAMNWIHKHPGNWVRLMLKKIVLFFGNHEIKNNKNIYFVTRFSSILRFFLAFLPFAVVGSLGVLGLFFILMKRPGAGPTLLLLFFLTYAFGVILFFVSARYRAPAMTVLIPSAAFALTTMWDASGRGRKGILFGGMAALIALVIFSFTDWYDIKPKDSSRDYWSVGNCFFEKDLYDLAEDSYLHALILDPDYDDAMNNLGELYFKTGDYSAALDLFKKLIQKHPDYVSGYNNLGVCYETLYMYPQAERYYRSAIDLYPGHIRARVNLVEVLLKMEKTDDAIKEWKTVLHLAPEPLRSSLRKDQRFQSLEKRD